MDEWVDDPSPTDEGWVDDTPEEESLGRKIGRGVLDHGVPALGAVGGGILGSAAGPVGSVGGAGLGYAAGQELSGILKNHLLGDEAPSTDLGDVASRVGSNLGKGAMYEMGGQVAGKALSAIPGALQNAGSGIKNVVDDVATAPLGAEAERGMIAGGLQKAHQAGKAGNEFLDELTPSLGPLSKVGRYGMAGKFQAGLDTLEQAPQAVQWGAGKISAGMDRASQFLMKSPNMAEVAKTNPKLFGGMAAALGSGFKQKDQRPDQQTILKKTQGTKYAQPLQEAAKRGDSGVGATNFILQSTDPEYRKLMLGEDDDMDQDELATFGE